MDENNPILNLLYRGTTTIQNFCWDNMSTVPLYTLVSPGDVEYIKNLILSPRYSGNNKYKMEKIDEVMHFRGFKRFAGGTNRLVYTHPYAPNAVFKVAIDAVGINDNPAEFRNQNFLKPYCCKVFECSPCGTIASFEKVDRITTFEEFYTIAEDCYHILASTIVGKYVMDDIGIDYFMNWGIRRGFGPVILDMPYLFELDGSKLECLNQLDDCSICRGEIDYDAGFNKLICQKCGRVYRARDLAKPPAEGGIMLRSHGGRRMTINIKRGNNILKTVDTTVERDHLSKNDKEVTNSRGVQVSVLKGNRLATKQDVIDINKKQAAVSNGAEVKIARKKIDTQKQPDNNQCATVVKTTVPSTPVKEAPVIAPKTKRVVININPNQYTANRLKNVIPWEKNEAQTSGAKVVVKTSKPDMIVPVAEEEKKEVPSIIKPVKKVIIKPAPVEEPAAEVKEEPVQVKEEIVNEPEKEYKITAIIPADIEEDVKEAVAEEPEKEYKITAIIPADIEERVISAVANVTTEEKKVDIPVEDVKEPLFKVETPAEPTPALIFMDDEPAEDEAKEEVEVQNTVEDGSFEEAESVEEEENTSHVYTGVKFFFTNRLPDEDTEDIGDNTFVCVRKCDVTEEMNKIEREVSDPTEIDRKYYDIYTKVNDKLSLVWYDFDSGKWNVADDGDFKKTVTNNDTVFRFLFTNSVPTDECEAGDGVFVCVRKNGITEETKIFESDICYPADLDPDLYDIYLRINDDLSFSKVVYDFDAEKWICAEVESNECCDVNPQEEDLVEENSEEVNDDAEVDRDDSGSEGLTLDDELNFCVSRVIPTVDEANENVVYLIPKSADVDVEEGTYCEKISWIDQDKFMIYSLYGDKLCRVKCVADEDGNVDFVGLIPRIDTDEEQEEEDQSLLKSNEKISLDDVED